MNRIATNRPHENPWRKCLDVQTVIFRTRNRPESDVNRKAFVQGRPKQLAGFYTGGGGGQFLSKWICFLAIYKLALQSYIHSQIIFCHDAVLNLYLAKLFLLDIHIFYVHHTPPPLTSNFVTIWTATRDPHIHPRLRLHSEDISMSFQKGGNAGEVIVESQDQATLKFILKVSQAEEILYLSKHGLQEQNHGRDDTTEQNLKQH